MADISNINELKITEMLGKEMPQGTIDFMVQNRIREYGENTKDFENNEKESIFFFLKDGDSIKAFGMLKPVTLSYDSKKYHIMGIGNIIAVEKSKGYGTILMNHIRNYLENSEYIGMGNTHSNNFNFYEKCGFIFIPNLIEKIVYIDEKGKEYKRDSEQWDHEIFIFDKGNELNELINGDGDAVSNVPFW